MRVSQKTFQAYGAARVLVLLFALSIMAVVGLIDAFAVAALVAFALLFFDRRTLAKVDYGLLLTFVALFVFVGNMARIPAVHEVLSALVGIAPFYAAVGSSQVISNVPAAVLLSGFTNDWTALIVGTNLGGLGTPIASMASLISLKIATASGLVGKRRYLAVFTVWNVAFLAVLCAANAVFGWA